MYHTMVLEVRGPKIKVMVGLYSFQRLRERMCPYLFHLLEAIIFLDSRLVQRYVFKYTSQPPMSLLSSSQLLP